MFLPANSVDFGRPCRVRGVVSGEAGEAIGELMENRGAIGDDAGIRKCTGTLVAVG